MSEILRGYHDIGGDPRHRKPVSTESGTPPGWGTLTDALRNALGDRYRLHEQRRKIEELGEEVYDSVTYYEIRVIALLAMSEERGFLSRGEVEARMKNIKERRAASDA
ncbi:MAG: nitrile hydratase subunit beta [Alphaproteobacteria bacterium]|nr:nitrile hydratase subunit beta [Alphaproteobacteria bacterium]